MVELVIKLSERNYEHIKNLGAIWIEKEGLPIITKALLDGTSLPKRHGDMIDRKEFVKSLNDWADDVDNYEAYEEVEIAKALLRSYAHTIIEADKEESELYANEWVGYSI